MTSMKVRTPTTSTSSTASSTERRARAVALALLAVAALLVATPAAAQYGKNKVQTHSLDWQVLVTPHFDIHFHDGAEELAVRASIIAERAYKEYADRLGRDLPFRVPFILYSSHSDFAQTNIADWLIGEGTGGFSEPFRNRIVLPYPASHEQFVHVIRHELVHVFMFDMAFGARSASVGANTFFQIPLWFAEGVAEWLSSGWNAEADMFIRDATINNDLPPLPYAGGFMVYKQGQAVMRLLNERYGPLKMNEFWRAVGRLRSVDAALRVVYGLDVEDLDDLFAREMRRRYYPAYGELEQADEILRPLTGEDDDGAAINLRPALSPDGDQVVYFSDRDGLLDLFLASAIDGSVRQRLGRSMRGRRFESFHSFRSGLTWSPDGREIALVARSGNVETLHTLEVATGRETRALDLGLDVAANPVWSPDGRSIVVVGTDLGRTDLYLVDLVPGDAPPAAAACAVAPPRRVAAGVDVYRLTNDVGDEGIPAWSPDGRRLAYAFNPRAEIASEFALLPDGRRQLLWARLVGDAAEDTARTAPPSAVHVLDLATGARHQLYAPHERRRDPVWLDDLTLAVVDVSSGIANLAVAELDLAGTTVVTDRRLTNVLGGFEHLTYSPARRPPGRQRLPRRRLRHLRRRRLPRDLVPARTYRRTADGRRARAAADGEPRRQGRHAADRPGAGRPGARLRAALPPRRLARPRRRHRLLDQRRRPGPGQYHQPQRRPRRPAAGHPAELLRLVRQQRPRPDLHAPRTPHQLERRRLPLSTTSTTRCSPRSASCSPTTPSSASATTASTGGRAIRFPPSIGSTSTCS